MIGGEPGGRRSNRYLRAAVACNRRQPIESESGRSLGIPGEPAVEVEIHGIVSALHARSAARDALLVPPACVSWSRAWRRRQLSAMVLAIGAGGWLDRAEMATYDWRTKLTADRSPANPEIVLVEINDSSVRDLSFFYGRWPWPRLAFADLITYLNRAPARVIAVDFTFPEEQHDVTFKIGGAGGESWTGEQSDKALVEAVRKANVHSAGGCELRR